MAGKTVEVKDIADKKIRLFKSREPYTVEVPTEVVESYEDVPLSVTLTPMTHREAEVRSRLKSAIATANSVSNYEAGIDDGETTKFMTELALLENGNEDKTEQEILKDLEAFQKKWKGLREKTARKDLTQVYKAEDDLRSNAVEVVLSNCKGLTFEGGDVVELSSDTIECVHPDLFNWILSKIEEESYLTNGEVLGFQ